MRILPKGPKHPAHACDCKPWSTGSCDSLSKQQRRQFGQARPNIEGQKPTTSMKFCDSVKRFVYFLISQCLTLAMLNKLRCHAHF